jgi:hypothetical protein
MASLSSMPDSRMLKSLILRSTYLDRVVASKDRHPCPDPPLLAFSVSLATETAGTELPTKIGYS